MPDTFTAFHRIPYRQLRRAEGMQALDQAFLDWLQSGHPEQWRQLLDFRQASWDEQRYENWLLDFSPLIAKFLAEGLGIESELQLFRAQAERDQLIYQFQSDYLKKLKHHARSWQPQPYQAAADAVQTLQFLSADDPEWALARCWLADADNESLRNWCLAAMLTAEGQQAVATWAVFQLPERLDLHRLIDTEDAADQYGSYRSIENSARRLRQGFDLTDNGMTPRQTQNEAHYCVYCHDKSGDFCSRGFPVNKKDKELGWREHATGELMLGCPVEEKVSQMHQLYAAGDLLAAFAVIMTDNPLCALTGHRICNDCMKSCIYQKQSPVNTPEVETGIVMQVLELPWGVEIYDILMRWNPLRREQPIEQSYNGKNIFVMGLGPAGISASHHLLMAGCGVVAADGARIQALPADWCENPIRDIQQIWQPLSSRPIRGFGGVAEYGITVRWNKNFLTLIQLLFQRRPYLAMHGDIRFGGTLTVEDVWQLGFDHLCLAVGAGLPRELRIPGSLAPGMRQANDFLMALQLTGAGRPGNRAALELRMPVIVIGGGLTGVDTATEAQAYYLQQIEQVEQSFNRLVEECGEDQVWSRFTAAETEKLEEWLTHAVAWRNYQQQCQAEEQPVDAARFLQRYGGVTIVYRKRLEDSPAYRSNHEELEKALQEGVRYRECLQPTAALCDSQAAVNAMRFKRLVKTENGWEESDDSFVLPAKSVLCATGATPNVAYEFEHHGTFIKKNKAYRPHRFIDHHLQVEERDEGHCKSKDLGMLTNYNDGVHRVSLLGDAHPWFHGSVVKAIASGKVALPQIMHSITDPAGHDFMVLNKQLADGFTATLQSQRRLRSGHVEWVVRAPWLAKKHQPGQFYRIGQASNITAEPVSAVAAVDPNQPDCLIFWLTESLLQNGNLNHTPVGCLLSVMGPTGAWSKPPAEKQRIIVIGGFLAAVYLRSVAPTWAERGHEFIWLNTEVAYDSADLFDAVSDVVPVSEGEWVDAVLDVSHPDAIHVIGDKDLLCRVQTARANEWKGQLKQDMIWIGSTYGPMQCMLKGVCAQCLQWQLNPETGERVKAVYACSWQHQPMDLIDLEHLGQRQQLKSIQEKLN